MRVAVVGTGYVGLTTGTSFADHGHEVMCIDNNPEKVAMMSVGIPPIFEDGLEAMMRRNISEGRLHFSTSLADVVGSAAIFLALPTPEGDDGRADLSHVLKVADELGPLLTEYTVVVNKSTVPPGTARLVEETIGKKARCDFDVVSNPEFLQEGKAIADVTRPARIVVGARSQRAGEVMDRLYAPYVRNGNPIIHTSPESAELSKYGSNGLLAVKISFANELARLAGMIGADITEVTRVMGTDPRIGQAFLRAGAGWGGSCFPKDSKALVSIGQEFGIDMKIMEAADRANDEQLQIIPNQIKKFYGEDLKDKKFALWGLAFKKDTDDVRESPAIIAAWELIQAGATVVAYDPKAHETAQREFARRNNGKDITAVTYADSWFDALKGADGLLIMTDWEAITGFDPVQIRKQLKLPVVFDGRLLLDPEEARKSGLYYYSIGRPVVDGR